MPSCVSGADNSKTAVVYSNKGIFLLRACYPFNQFPVLYFTGWRKEIHVVIQITMSEFWSASLFLVMVSTTHHKMNSLVFWLMRFYSTIHLLHYHLSQYLEYFPPSPQMLLCHFFRQLLLLFLLLFLILPSPKVCLNMIIIYELLFVGPFSVNMQSSFCTFTFFVRIVSWQLFIVKRFPSNEYILAECVYLFSHCKHLGHFQVGLLRIKLLLIL